MPERGAMEAVGFQEHGDIDNLQLLDAPLPVPMAVLVKVAAAELNHQHVFAVRELDHSVSDHPFWSGSGIF